MFRFLSFSVNVFFLWGGGVNFGRFTVQKREGLGEALFFVGFLFLFLYWKV